MSELVGDATPKEIEAGVGKSIIKSRPKRNVPDGRVEPFPKRRFLQFISMLRVQTKDYGLVPLELLGSQMYVLDEIIDGIKHGVTTFVVLKGRQQGISTLCLALDLFWSFENKGLLGIFATHDEGSRDQFRNQIDVFLTTLPKTHRIEYETNNRLMLVLKNSSMFRYLVAGTRTSTNKMGRSGGCNFLHATEVAFWGSADDIKALGQTLSELYPHRLYIYESTANGFNHYADMWDIAKDSPAQKAIFSGWWRDERNEFHAKHPLYKKYMPRDVRTPLTQLERKRMKNVKEKYDFTITAGQIAWYRFHLETKCSSDQSAMDQEHPWTEEDAFIATGDSFFPNETLTSLMKEARKSLCLPFLVRLSDNFQDTVLQRVGIDTASLKIWEKPSPFGKYVIGADPIFGSSSYGDNGVISIWRCYADGCDQVAEFCTSSVSTFQFAWVLCFLAGLYKDVVLNLEITGPGAAVYQEMKQLKQKLAAIPLNEDPDMRNCLKFMKDFFYRKVDSMSGNVLLQWKTSPETRIQLLHKFHDGLETRRAKVRSLACLEEARTMTIDEGHISCPPSKCDDRVFGASLAYWAWDESVRTKMLTMGMTRAKAAEVDARGSIDPVDGLVARFMRDAKISVPNK